MAMGIVADSSPSTSIFITEGGLSPFLTNLSTSSAKLSTNLSSLATLSQLEYQTHIPHIWGSNRPHPNQTSNIQQTG
jgi:hypothetical protein